jgi:hypothetical protein
MKHQPNTKKRIYLLSGLIAGISLHTSTAPAQSNRPMVGIVKEVKGAPDVLRDPSDKLSDDMKTKARRDGYRAVLYKAQYWKAYPLRSGLPIYYGDILSSGHKAKMALSLEDGFQIILAKNTKVRVTPNFVKKHKSSLIQHWIHLLSGKIRAYILEKSQTKPKTNFRSRSMALGVRGTDFFFSVDGDHSKLVTIEGHVAARSVSAVEAELYDTAANAYLSDDQNELANSISRLNQLPAESSVMVTSGEKIEHRATESDSPDSEPAILQAEALTQPEIAELRAVGTNIKSISNNKNLQDLDKTVTKGEPANTINTAQTAVHQPFSARAAIEGLNVTYDNTEFNGSGLSLGIDYRPWKYFFASISYTRGQWHLSKLAAEYGGDMDQFTIDSKSYQHLAAGFGARMFFSENWSIGVGMSLISGRTFKMSDPNGRQLEFDIEPTGLIRLELTYNFYNDATLILGLGGGSTKAELKTKGFNGPSSYYHERVDVEQGYSKIGLGWNFGS